MSAYDPADMRADCVEVGRNLRLERAVAKAVENRPVSLHFEDYPREVHKRGEIAVSDAAARLAGAMHLHLD